jgi:dynein heavy chain 1, cytosolic
MFETDLAAQALFDLGRMVSEEVPATTPLALVSVTGYDASFRVENLVTSSGSKCQSVAMGSQEGFTLAEQAIAAAARQGTWVLLKNVHLAPSWLGQLEKKLQNANPSRNFRLFLTMEANMAIPVNILRQSRIIMNEPPPGIKANLLDSLKGIPPSRLSRGPAEKIRLYFLLAWFHAVVQERLRYVPLGWSKIYDFNDSDMEAAFNTIDQWLNIVAKGRANVDPATIPWEAIKSLVKQAVYGGRIDSDFDQKIMDAFVDNLFTPKAYNVDFDLVPRLDPNKTMLSVPEGTKLEHFLTWVNGLPEREPPAWLSLPPTAERVIAISQGMFVFLTTPKSNLCYKASICLASFARCVHWTTKTMNPPAPRREQSLLRHNSLLGCVSFFLTVLNGWPVSHP